MIAAADAWAWLAVVLFIVLLRITSRFLLKTAKGLQLEDGLMVFTTACYIALTITLYELSKYGTNAMPLDKTHVDPNVIPRLVHGSKLVIVCEQMWLATIWGCKGSLLLLYSSMTMGLHRHRLVLFMAVFCVLGYIVIQILFFACWCRPFSAYWSVPPKSIQCSVYRNHLITVLALNVSSDLFMMFIPLPLLIIARLNLAKKATLCAVFSLGAFVIVCCILSKYYSITNPYGGKWIDWYIREAGTAVIVANIPHCWPLVRRLLNVREFFSNNHYSSYVHRTQPSNSRPKSSMAMSYMRSNMSSMSRSMLRRSSSERTVDRPAEHLEIWEHKNFHITEEPGYQYQTSIPGSSEGSHSLENSSAIQPCSERENLRTNATVTTAV